MSRKPPHSISCGKHETYPDFLSPDKNPGVKNIQERFARLGVITAILRSPESRERYNVSWVLLD